MKGFLIFFLFIFSIGGYSQFIEVSDEVCVEWQFINLYESYCKKRKIERVQSELLDSVIIVHANYLSTFTIDSGITHDGGEYGSFGNRLRFLKTDHQPIAGEVCAVVPWHGETDCVSIAEWLFNNLKASSPHKALMFSKKFRWYQFKVGRYRDGSFFIIGVFTRSFTTWE